MPAGASSPPVENRAPDREGVGRAPLHQVLVRAVKSFLAHQMTDRAAFQRVREHARSTNRTVVDVAAAVAEGHALLPKARD